MTGTAPVPVATAELFHHLNAVSAASHKPAPFEPTVIRLDHHGRWCLMNRPDRGWAEYAYPYPSLEAIARNWSLRFVSFGQDEHSHFITVEPAR